MQEARLIVNLLSIILPAVSEEDMVSFASRFLEEATFVELLFLSLSDCIVGVWRTALCSSQPVSQAVWFSRLAQESGTVE